MNPVLLYYPNLVGYARIVVTSLAFSLCFTNQPVAAFLYLLGQGLDAIDGTVARMYNQCSLFGGVLDMLTDRMSTATLLIVLSHLYPHAWGMFAFLVVLDIVSHWFQMYSTLVQGQNTHKGSNNPILNFYYTFPYALLVFCVGHEVFLVALYLLAFVQGPVFIVIGAVEMTLVRFIAYLCFPIFVAKTAMNVVQLWDAISEIVTIDYAANQKKRFNQA